MFICNIDRIFSCNILMSKNVIVLCAYWLYTPLATWLSFYSDLNLCIYLHSMSFILLATHIDILLDSQLAKFGSTGWWRKQSWTDYKNSKNYFDVILRNIQEEIKLGFNLVLVLELYRAFRLFFFIHFSSFKMWSRIDRVNFYIAHYP